jgi:rare lipoprotein A (peptidoglycan hydrolase)
LLQNGPTAAPRPATAALGSTKAPSHAALRPASHLDNVVLPSHLVAYDAPPTTTPAPPPTTTPTTAAPVTTTTEAPAPTTTTAAPHVAPAPVIAAPTAASPLYSENGEATWYSEAPDGYCASPTLPFGTVLTVRNDATGATTSCKVDDREESPYPRVVDMSYAGFSQIADPSQGVVDVTISW